MDAVTFLINALLFMTVLSHLRITLEGHEKNKKCLLDF